MIVLREEAMLEQLLIVVNHRRVGSSIWTDRINIIVHTFENMLFERRERWREAEKQENITGKTCINTNKCAML